ncbi:ADP-ribose pyrophosphatase YjhB, NUDIX family [Halovenus aranensis]|uniref:ADP-ribose pyrophosphatase YjhB, NUDIX family n=1 Tax=Halovenus aranensis TaxID=890420 RepID=A0A1G8XY33_9EURY|nr:NUDIX domain-containing protein [Halovenus aranensis]SDJ94795.1 ADP-ribose pyrophosphatase YjhB, NUDIX family [Halovenus aranensis]
MSDARGRRSTVGAETPARLREGVKALASTGTSVLLVKERHSDGDVFWTLPGGGLRAGESRIEGLQRELREELGCDIVATDRATTMVYAHHSQDVVSLYHTFQCLLLSEVTPARSHGILECRWVSPTDLPPATLPQVRTAVHSVLGGPSEQSTH